jgi:hypothetical protein
MSDPRWYKHLSRQARDVVDQTLHVLWFGSVSLFLSPSIAWAWAHYREFHAQAPIERIDDTERDLRFSVFGALGSTGLKLSLVLCVVIWIYTHIHAFDQLLHRAFNLN